MSKFFKISSLVTLVLLTTYAVYAEQVTMSTFYPSPRGEYITLQSTGLTQLAMNGGSATVGTGAVNPLAVLDVRGDAHFTRAGLGAGATLNQVGALNIETNQLTPVSTRLKFGTDNTGWMFAIGTANIPNIFVVKDNGNVGIGSAAATTPPSGPQTALHVGGEIYITKGDGTNGTLQITCPGGSLCYATPTYQS